VVTTPGVGPFLGSDFDYGFRAARITDLVEHFIDNGTPMTVEDSVTIQFDNYTPAAAKIVPVLKSINFNSDWQAAGQNLLEDWDFKMESNSAPAAYFAAAWNHIMQLTFWDELPEGSRPDGTSRWLVVVSQMLNNPDDPFWDDRSTLNGPESRDEILRMAMLDARNELTTRVSSNTDDWSWGALHQLELVSPVIGTDNSPRVLQWLANPPVISTSGSTLSINSTAWPARIGEMGVMNGPAFRVVMDTGNFDASTWVNVPGNSGHIRSEHYTDQLEAWNTGAQYPFRFTNTAGQTNFLGFIPQ
jgi:penicillin amidase